MIGVLYVALWAAILTAPVAAGLALLGADGATVATQSVEPNWLRNLLLLTAVLIAAVHFVGCATLGGIRGATRAAGTHQRSVADPTGVAAESDT